MNSPAGFLPDTARAAPITPRPALTRSGHVVGGCNGCGYGIALPDGGETAVSCPGCGQSVRLMYVTGIMSDDVCDDRCMFAKRASCECNCGGWNHGTGWLAGRVPTWQVADAQAANVARFNATRDRAAERRETKARAERKSADDHRAGIIDAYPILAQLLDDTADVAGVLNSGNDYDPFLADMRLVLMSEPKNMTERRINAAVSALERRAARIARQVEREAGDVAARAAGVRVPTGRITFTGVIVGYKPVQDNFSYHDRTIDKITVRHADGWRVYGTLPAGLKPPWSSEIADAYQGWTNRLTGQTVTITATVEPSADNQLFGFFKQARPGKDARPLSHLGPDAQAADVTPAAPVAQAEPVAPRPTRPASKPAPVAQVDAEPVPDMVAMNAVRELIDRAWRDVRDGRRATLGSLTTGPARPDDAAHMWVLLVMGDVYDTAVYARTNAATRAALSLPADADADAVYRAVKRDGRDADTLARAYLAAYRAAYAGPEPAAPVAQVDTVTPAQVPTRPRVASLAALVARTRVAPAAPRCRFHDDSQACPACTG